MEDTTEKNYAGLKRCRGKLVGMNLIIFTL